MKVFEETFGIDKLQASVSKIGEKLHSNEYDPINNQYLLSDNDLKKTAQLMDEFQTRHASIKESIE